MIAAIPSACKSLRARIFAAALLLPLIAFATATSGNWLRCRMTGEMLSACCCGSGEETPPVDSPPTVSEADCCDRVVQSVTPARAALTVAMQVRPDQSAALDVIPLVGPATDIASARVAVRADTRASIGPPTVRLRLVFKSAFLI